MVHIHQLHPGTSLLDDHVKQHGNILQFAVVISDIQSTIIVIGRHAMSTGRMHLRLRFACGDIFAIGPGKADLLQAIEREGSIAAAGRALGMSYRRAWLLTDEMNRCFRERLVETAIGGGRERGARLSPFGKEMLTTYRALVDHVAAVTDSEAYRKLLAGMRDAPIPK